jgi:type I restriction enzyme S subunit
MSEPKGLPSTWAEVPIEILLQPLEDGRILHHGWSPQCETEPSQSDDDWGVLKTTAIQDGLYLSEHNKLLPQALEPRTQFEVKTGDILITCAGPRNRCGVPCLVRHTRPRLILSGKMYRFRVRTCLMHAAFMEGYLREKDTQEAIDQMKTGISDSGLNLTHGRFLRLTVPIAPLNEQRRIIAKIEELISDLDSGVAALKRAKANLKRYRASVLKAAVDGSLTAEWRAKHPNVEPASKLLERILAECRRKWEADQLAKFKAAGKEPPKNWRAKYVEQSPPDTVNLPELPAGWCWTCVEQMTENFDGQRVPVKAENRAKRQGQYPYYGASGIIDSVDDYLFDGRFLLLAEDGANLLSRSTPIAFEAEGRFWVNNHAHILRTIAGIPLAYLRHFFNGTRLDFSITGTAQPKLTQAAMNRVPVPLPSIFEQHQIVAEVAEKLSKIEAAEVAIEHGLLRATRLRQSILKQAFEGKLVPQDPSDESASVLLSRIMPINPLEASLERKMERGENNAGKPERAKRRRSTASRKS